MVHHRIFIILHGLELMLANTKRSVSSFVVIQETVDGLIY